MVYTKDDSREMQVYPPFQRVNPAYDQIDNRGRNAMPIYCDQSSALHNVGPAYDYIDNGREPEKCSTKKDHSQLSLLRNANPAYISRKGEKFLLSNSEEIHFQPSIIGKTNPSYTFIKQGSENKFVPNISKEECFQLSPQQNVNPAYDHIAQVRGSVENKAMYNTVEEELDGSVDEYFDNTGRPIQMRAYETPLLINKDNYNCAHVDEEENDRHDYDYIENYQGGFFQ